MQETKKVLNTAAVTALFSAVLIALGWAVWKACIGPVPVVQEVVLTTGTETAEPLVVDLSFDLSRWWDVLFSVFHITLVAGLIRLAIYPDRYSDLRIGIVLGLIVGLAIGQGVGLSVELIGEWLIVGLTVNLSIGLLFGLTYELLFGPAFALAFGLTYSAVCALYICIIYGGAISLPLMILMAAAISTPLLVLNGMKVIRDQVTCTDEQSPAKTG